MGCQLSGTRGVLLGNGDPPLCNPFYGAQRGLVAQGEDGRRLLRTEQRLDGPVSVFSGATLAFVRYLQKMSERRRVLPEYDLMSALVQAEEGGAGLARTSCWPCRSCSSLRDTRPPQTFSPAARWRSSSILTSWRN